MRKNREHILNKLDIVNMAIKQLKKEGKGIINGIPEWTSVDFWKKFIAIYEYIKKAKHKDLTVILN